MKNTFRKLTTLMLALLFTASLPLTALAEVLSLDIANGSISIGDNSATQNDTLHPHSGTVVVTGTSTENNVSVDVTQNVTVVLDDVNIDTSDSTGGAVEVKTNSSEAVVTVELDGTNTLAGDTAHAGLEVSGSGGLVIQDETTLQDGVLVDGADGASLKATAGYGAAGIGGKIYEDGNNITITGGTIIATGGQNAAGIGAGNGGNASNITITGGTVQAKGSSGGAGIGGGEGDSRYGVDGEADNITITGGNVTAEGSDGGAGIGGGARGEADSIVITGGTVNATGGSQAAGIGSGLFADAGSITITDGTVTATGGYNAAGIGGGDGGKAGQISFSGDAQVTAIGGDAANDIGGGAGQDAVTPDISELTTNGWYQAGADGERVSGTSVSSAQQEAQKPCYFTVNSAWRQSKEDGVLTVTSDEENAALTIRGWGIRGLRSRGIHTLVFVTAQAETTLDIAKLASECEGADKYVIAHTGTETVLTRNGETL